MQTIQVMWPKKFGQRIVTINAADFDPAIHLIPGGAVSTGTVEAPIAEPEPVVEVEPPAEPEKPTRRRK